MLVVGCMEAHWYVQDDIDYVGTLGLALTPVVLATGGALGRLDEEEQEAARLLGEGLSATEIGSALGRGQPETNAVIDRTLRKLNVRSASEIGRLGGALAEAIRQLRALRENARRAAG